MSNKPEAEISEEIPTITEPKSVVSKRANNLTGKEWTRNSISIWSDIRKTEEEISLRHPAIFPSQLVRRIIDSFTNSDKNLILDPFCGSGSTVVTASRMGHIGIGIELNPDYVEMGNVRLHTRELWNPNLDTESKIINGDARLLKTYLGMNSVDLVITSPPYWDILSQKRTADGKEIRNYGSAETDLGNIGQYEQFVGDLSSVFEGVFWAMKSSAYCIVVVMDIRKKDKFYPLHSSVAQEMQKLGFIFDDLIIWDRRHEYNSLRPLGYPAVFRINKVHEFILIFKKP